MPSVIFNPTAFKIRYPEFVATPDATLSACFDEACLYLSNSNASPVQDIPRRTLLLNMLTAHVAKLGGFGAGASGVAPVGRLSSATEGSVSASLEYAQPGSNAWYAQTQYGASYWQATLNLRRFRYIPQPTVTAYGH